MHLYFAISIILARVASAADLQSAQHVLGFMGSSGLVVERQVIECAKVDLGPRFCERSCGPLFASCVIATKCYLPSLGQTCCANSAYCPAGTYCATLGCCINGSSLAECNANLTSGNTALAPSVPSTLLATKPTTVVATSQLVATTPLVATSSLFTTTSRVASSKSAVLTSSSPSASSPTLAATTPPISTSPTSQTSRSNDAEGLASELPSTARTTSATLPTTTPSGIPALNSGSRNSKDFMGLVYGSFGFLLIL